MTVVQTKLYMCTLVNTSRWVDSSTHTAIYVYISKNKALFGIATVLVIDWVLHFYRVFCTSVVVLAPSVNIATPVAHTRNASRDWTQQLTVLHCTCTCTCTVALHWTMHVASITSSFQVFACINAPSRPPGGPWPSCIFLPINQPSVSVWRVWKICKQVKGSYPVSLLPCPGLPLGLPLGEEDCSLGVAGLRHLQTKAVAGSLRTFFRNTWN